MRFGNRWRGCLAALNVVLVATLGALLLATPAGAQRDAARARGEYVMVSGNIRGGSAAVVYVVDVANQEFIALRWNESSKGLDGLGYRDLKADSGARPGR